MNKQQEVIYKLTKEEMREMTGSIPFIVQVRVKLNDNGFRFNDDDDVFSVFSNENPRAIGKLTSWMDHKTGTITLKQELIVDEN